MSYRLNFLHVVILRFGGFNRQFRKRKNAFHRQRRLGLPGCLVYMKLICTIALQSTGMLDRTSLHLGRIRFIAMETLKILHKLTPVTSSIL